MHEKRLNKLADFLDELPRRRFDFSMVVDLDRKKPGMKCGSVCCAVGWCPTVFPRLVKWKKTFCAWTNAHYYDLFEPTTRAVDYDEVAAALFDVPVAEAKMLFTPIEEVRPWDTRVVGLRATPRQVARSIRNFVRWKKEAR